MPHKEIVIIDYGVGNLNSVQKKVQHIGFSAIVSSDPKEIEAARALILPGVGFFSCGMENLRKRGLQDILNRKVLVERTPILGICLGMQLMTDWSEEGDVAGLGWISGRTTLFRFPPDRCLPVPHIGWNTIQVSTEHPLFNDISFEQRFYFTHSYHVVPRHPEDALARTDYGFPFVSIIRRENILGVQFHPEKSHLAGMKIIRNFFTCCGLV